MDILVAASDLQKIADYTGTASELNVLDLGTNQNLGIFKIATSVPTQVQVISLEILK